MAPKTSRSPTTTRSPELGEIRLPAHRPPTHPGEMLLKEFLEPLGMTQSELARRIGVSWPRINELVNA